MSNSQVDQLIKDRPGFEAMVVADKPDIKQIAKNIYMSEGTSNAYMVITAAGRVIINTGMGFEALMAHKPGFDAIHAGPTPYIFLTQGHVDHVGGVSQFRETSTKLIAQKNNSICQQDDERIQKIRSSQAYIWFQKTIDTAIKVASTNPEVFVQDRPVPDICFDDKHELTVGDTRFVLLSTPGGETIDSAVVWMPDDKTLFTGNLFGPLFPHFPNINTIRGDKYRYIDPYLASLGRVRKLEAETLITGHFTPIEGKQLILDSLNRLEAAVKYVHTETLTRMNRGENIFCIMKTLTLPKELSVGEGYGKVSWAARTIWESYMGWFKAEHTSELYPINTHAIYPDLLKLCSLEKAINLCHNFITGKDYDKALLLTEAIATAYPNHPETLALSIEVHRELLEQAGDNFWLRGWLNKQINNFQQELEKIPE
ncbi:MAG: MBL fold metallo-hydrolase [Pseudomonadales bacterium]|nr:MBL fold metallo-hydrolase [Pseudomonadales bacterium]